MEKIKAYDNFPISMILFPNLVAVLLYLAGLIIMYELSLIAAILYLVYLAGLEYRLLSRHCVNCYYYGKTCGFGKGRISSLFFKKGDPMRFCENSFEWKDMIPDLLVTLVPLVIGIVLIFIKFNILLLISMLILVGLSTMGNAFVRGHITCKFCKQRELGCPAEKLFSK